MNAQPDSQPVLEPVPVPKPLLPPMPLAIPQAAVSKPTDLIRTALFSVAKNVPLPLPDTEEWKKTMLVSEEIYCREGTKLKFTGQKLDTRDEDLFVCLLKIHSDNRLVVGNTHTTTFYQLAKAMGLNDSQQSYDFVKLRLERLATARLNLSVRFTGRNGKSRDMWSAFSLVSVVYNKETGSVGFFLDPFGMDFLGRMTNLEMDVWTKLPSGLPRQLFGFVRSNESEKVVGYSLKKLASNFGWEGRRCQFRTALLKAFEQLFSNGIVSDYGVIKGKGGEQIVKWKVNKFIE